MVIAGVGASESEGFRTTGACTAGAKVSGRASSDAGADASSTGGQGEPSSELDLGVRVSNASFLKEQLVSETNGLGCIGKGLTVPRRVADLSRDCVQYRGCPCCRSSVEFRSDVQHERLLHL